MKYPNFMDSFGTKLAGVAERLIGEEVLRSRVKRPVALRIVAREAGVSPGTVENLVRGRLKNVGRVKDGLIAILEASIVRKMAELETELTLIRETSFDQREPDILGAEAALASAKKCLGRAR